MSILICTVSTARPTAQLVSLFETAGGKHTIAQRFQNFINSLQTGSELAFSSSVPPTLAFSIQENATRASGTIIFSGAATADDTVLINGVTFTAVASGATGNQWNVGLTATATADNLAAAINASATALVSAQVTASAASGTLTITSKNYGVFGNQTTIAEGVDFGNVMTVSGARLTGGAADATALSLTF